MHLSKLFAVAAISLVSAGHALAGELETTNKRLVSDFYNLAFIQHKPTEAAQKYIGTVYIQHNPRVPNGADAFYGFFEGYFKKNPSAISSVKRVLADGDLVAIHSHSQAGPQDPGKAVVDIFRVDAGKIVEHWDVMQDVTGPAPNGNTMFDGDNAK